MSGNLTRSILRQYRQVDDETWVAGMNWYDEVFAMCERLGDQHGVGPAQVAAALAHLSPRIQWGRNVTLLEMLLASPERPSGIFARSWSKALQALSSEDPLDTFGRTAYKTRAFAWAILGDPDAVVVDVWAARVAGAHDNAPKSLTGYTLLSEAYRRASRLVDITARDLQAVTWVHLRGRAA